MRTCELAQSTYFLPGILRTSLTNAAPRLPSWPIIGHGRMTTINAIRVHNPACQFGQQLLLKRDYMFAVLLHQNSRHEHSLGLKKIENLYRNVYKAATTEIIDPPGATLVLGSTNDMPPVFYTDDRGWIVLQGLIFNVDSNDPYVDAKALLNDILRNGARTLNRYEGAFSFLAWNKQDKSALVVSDQAATLRTFYGRADVGFYATTTPLPMAVSLRLELDPQGLREFFARGQVIAPTSIYRGMKCLEVGKHLLVQNGGIEPRRHWTPYQMFTDQNRKESAETLAEAAMDRTRRIARLRSPILFDCTGGYDSRFGVASADGAGVDFALTVNGGDDSDDVIIGKKVAEALGREMIHYREGDVWTVPIDGEMRREMLYRTGGTLKFSEIYHHVLTRPELAKKYKLHCGGGVATDIARYYPWGQEFFGIGKRQIANVGNALNYRFLQEGPPRDRLFRQQWYPTLRDELYFRIEAVCQMVPETLTTQQLDAVAIWKNTGHFSSYSSALSGWLPTVPLASCAGTMDAALMMPWTFKATSHTLRRAIHIMSPKTASVVTQYGNNSAPVTASTLHREAYQLVKRLVHLASKIEKVKLKGAFSSKFPKKNGRSPRRIPYLTPEFRKILDPKEMFCRELFVAENLKSLLCASDDKIYANESMILKIATVEMLCRELDIRLEGDLLCS